MTPAFVLAWVLPLGAGIALWMACVAQRRPGWVAGALGYGGVSGMLLAAAATCVAARADTVHALARAGVWLALLAMAAGFVAWRRKSPARVYEGEKDKKWINVPGVIGLALLAWRGWVALREILLRPTYPWDAWDAWAVKSKTWVLLGHYVPFVPIGEWLRRPTQDLYTSIAWGYPPTLAWMQVWFASAAGGWVEPLVNLPWFALWLALLFGHYGQWRALGISRNRALAGAYALGSLPLLDVHVALAGYADIWVAAVLGFAVLAWLRWQQQGDRVQLLVALVCAALLPLLKLEGAVWLPLFGITMLYGLLPKRWRRRAFAAVAGLFMLAALLCGLRLPLPGLGWVDVGRGYVTVPVIGHLNVAWHGAAFVSVLNGLFVQPNWHLLWWLTPLIVAWRWCELLASEATRQLGSFLLAGLAFLVFLFVFTDAASWAESYTAINRLLMHLVPALVTLLMLLLRDVDWRALPHTPNAPAARSAQA